MKVLRNSLYLVLAGMLAGSFTACSSDDNENDVVPQSGVELSFASANPDTTVFVSKGTFEVTVRLKGITKTPAASDFTTITQDYIHSDLRFNWDTFYAATRDVVHFPTDTECTVTNVRKGDSDDTYILTMDYDAEGYMTSVVNFSLYYGQNARTENTFRLSYEAYAQKSVGLPLHTYKTGEVPDTIDVSGAFAQLGLSTEHMLDAGTHGLYGCYSGDKTLDITAENGWNAYDDVFLDLTLISGKTPCIKMVGANNLKPGYTYFVQYIISLG